MRGDALCVVSVELTVPCRVTDDVKPQYAGHVVAVVERMPGQLFSGTLGLLRPSSAATKEKQEAERREREGDSLIFYTHTPLSDPTRDGGGLLSRL